MRQKLNEMSRFIKGKRAAEFDKRHRKQHQDVNKSDVYHELFDSGCTHIMLLLLSKSMPVTCFPVLLSDHLISFICSEWCFSAPILHSVTISQLPKNLHTTSAGCPFLFILYAIMLTQAAQFHTLLQFMNTKNFQLFILAAITALAISEWFYYLRITGNQLGYNWRRKNMTRSQFNQHRRDEQPQQEQNISQSSKKITEMCIIYWCYGACWTA